jgi:hypothetical protein
LAARFTVLLLASSCHLLACLLIIAIGIGMVVITPSSLLLLLLPPPVG